MSGGVPPRASVRCAGNCLPRIVPTPSRWFAVVFFDSFESAMKNSDLPETQASALEYQKMSDGPPVFYDLEIVEDRA
jgi:hypothetical protein